MTSKSSSHTSNECQDSVGRGHQGVAQTQACRGSLPNRDRYRPWSSPRSTRRPRPGARSVTTTSTRHRRPDPHATVGRECSTPTTTGDRDLATFRPNCRRRACGCGVSLDRAGAPVSSTTSTAGRRRTSADGTTTIIPICASRAGSLGRCFISTAHRMAAARRSAREIVGVRPLRCEMRPLD
jgi:hypothetical protein